MRVLELGIFLAPLAAFLMWRAAAARGLDGPEPWQLAVVFVALLAMGGALVVLTERERLPPGEYVPAHLEGGKIVRGHTSGGEPAGPRP